RLFLFLAGASQGLLMPWSSGVRLPWYAWDILLAVQFAVPHSWLLLPGTRQRLQRLVPAPFYGCFFCSVTCLCLLATIELWQRQSAALWRLDGTPAALVRAVFLAFWPALIYSLSLTGLAYQTGWTPWWAWLRGRLPPPRQFRPRGAYRLIRHPVYL